jgi:dihydrofolate reductase
MGKVVVTMFYSLDGVMEEPAWTFPYWNDEIAAFKGSEFEALDAHLLGRVTYEGFAEAWPPREGEPGADTMNNMPKHVATTTLKNLEWNNSHILEGDLTEAVNKLKAQYEGDILVAGSATLVNSLLERNLVDEIRLLVYPVVLGKGKRLFTTEAKLKLIETKTFSSGVVLLRYVLDTDE